MRSGFENVVGLISAVIFTIPVFVFRQKLPNFFSNELILSCTFLIALSKVFIRPIC